MSCAVGFFPCLKCAMAQKKLKNTEIDNRARRDGINLFKWRLY